MPVSSLTKLTGLVGISVRAQLCTGWPVLEKNGLGVCSSCCLRLLPAARLGGLLRRRLAWASIRRLRLLICSFLGAEEF